MEKYWVSANEYTTMIVHNGMNGYVTWNLLTNRLRSSLDSCTWFTPLLTVWCIGVATVV